MSKQRRLLMGLGLATVLLGSACTKEEEPMMQQPSEPPASLGPGEASAFMHEGSLYTFVDPNKDGNQLPSSESELRHTCGKISYDTLGRILRFRGIGTGTTTPERAGTLYANGSLPLGAANFVQRIAETDRNTTASIVRLYDVLLAGVEELISTTTAPANPHGIFPVGSDCYTAALFNSDDTCNASGLGCFVGVPLTVQQLTQCNDAVVDLKSRFAPATTAAIDAKRIAVASLATAIYLCD